MKPFLRARWEDIGIVLALLTRVPTGSLPSSGEAGALGRAVWAYPLVGALVGGVGGAVIVAAHAIGIPHLVAALLGLAATILMTGAFHEDGLADFCDGIGGGTTPERRLEIMRDSRIGTYGALALVLSIGLRLAALSSLTSEWPLILVWMSAGALARASLVVPLGLLIPARPDGMGAGAARPPLASCVGAYAIAGGLSLAALSGEGLVLIGVSLAAGLVVALIARRMLNGYTGDVLGATVQVSEIACLIAACTRWSLS